MQPFRVICETCHARLKISSESVVGQIHACPKCGSMVEIRLPADGMAPPPSTISGASIEIGVGTLATTFDDLAMPPSAPPNPPVAVMPPALLGSASLVWWGVGGISILIAGGLAGIMLLGGNETTPRQNVPVAQVQDEDSTKPEREPVASDPLPSTGDEAAPSAPPIAAPDVQADENVTAEVERSDPAAALPEVPALPSTEPEPAAVDEPASESVSDGPPAAAASSEAPPASAPSKEKPRPKPVMNFDPLDFDPSQFSFSTGEAAAVKPDPNSIPSNADVENDAVNDHVQDATTEKAAVDTPKVDRSLTVRLGPIVDGHVRAHRAAEQLGTRVESFSVADVPLCRFVDTVSDLADVAVTLDPIELELAGVSSRQKVSTDSKGGTVEKVLIDVLTKQRLDLIERDGRIGIALAGGEKRREVTYDVADLAGPHDATPIANLVQRFVAPDSWKAASGSGTIQVDKTKLRIEHSQRVRHEVLIFCERLRLARGLPQRSRYPASLLVTVSSYEAAAPALEQRATFTLLPWTRLGEVVRHWQDASKLTILVDWRALAERELGPSSPVACSAINRSWADALDGILEPIGLAWWPVNGETIQITSREVLDGIRRIEFYTVPKPLRDQFATGDQLVDSLQDDLAELTAKAHAKSQPVIMQLDEPSGRLIVLGTPVSHRYLTRRLGRDGKQVASQN